MEVAPRGCHAVTNSRGIAQHSDTVAFAQCGRRAAKFQVRRIQRVLGYCIPRSTACCPSSNCTRRRCVNSRRVSSSTTISRWTTCQQHSPSSRVACCMYLSRLYLECHPTPLSSIHFLAYAYLRLSRKKSHELSFFSITPSYISIIDVTIKVCITRVGHKTNWAPSAPPVCFDPLKDLGGDIVKMYCKEREVQQNC